MTIPRPFFIVLLITLNALPLYGVFSWGWQSFDLIFLYWLENLIIGAFMILRIVVRPYSHAVELAMPVFFAPFFAMHYGMFCFAHGTFVISLFGKALPADLAGTGIPEIILPVIESRQLFWPLMGLFAYQLLDWIRDISERGLGSDGITQLTTAPYRRIIVLHITILASGFALSALHEPLAGLILLIVFKTWMDLYHWNRDEQAATNHSKPGINANIRQKVDAFLDEPRITVNGREIRYNSFEELKASKHYGLMQALLRMVGGGDKLREIEAYVEQRLVQHGRDNARP